MTFLYKGWTLVMWFAARMALRRRCRPSSFYSLDGRLKPSQKKVSHAIESTIKDRTNKILLLDPLILVFLQTNPSPF